MDRFRASGPTGGFAQFRRSLRGIAGRARTSALRAAVHLTGDRGSLGRHLEQLKAPIEASPFLQTGRRVPQRPEAALGPDDYGRLLAALGPLGVVRFEDLGGSPRGVGLRLDLSTGLTEEAFALARLEDAAGVPSLKAISPFVAGDLLAFSEGRAGIEPRAWPLLQSLGRGNGRRFACLNELADGLLVSQADPWGLYAELERAFQKQRLPLLGFVTGLGDDPATDLAWLLLHRGAWDGFPDELLASFGVVASELRKPGGKGRALAVLDGGPPRPGADFDWLERLDLEPIGGGQRAYSRRLRRSVTRRFRPRLISTVAARLETSPDGFLLRDRNGEARALASTEEALDALAAAAGIGPVAVICDVAHFSGVRPAATGDVLRALPHPFHHALALSSDVDWSSEAQVRAGFDRLNGELGLSVGGSFFVEGPPEASVAALPIPRAGSDRLGLVAELAARGGMDTLHAFRSNVRSLDLVRDDDGFVLPDGAGPIRAEAFLVEAAGDSSGTTLHVWSDQGSCKLAPDPPSAKGGPVCFSLPAEWQARGLVCERLRVRLEGSKASAVVLTDFAPTNARDALQRAAADHLAPLVYTTHGGGTPDVLRLGNLHVGAAPDDDVCDMDRADRPYHLLPDLLRLGVRFFSPRGHAGTSALHPADALVHETILRDGSRVGAFRRFLGRRTASLGLSDGWAFGKNAANPAALGFQISDLLLRLHWLPEGQAAILYNHFGHNIGNQVCDRLAWSEELHGAFERIAALHHPDGGRDAHAYRLWVCAPSSLLLYSAVRQAVAANVRVDGSDISLEAFDLPLLGVEPTDRARFGTRLLHGQTFFVADADRASLTVAGEPVYAFSRNAAGAEGRPSISIVDDSAPRAVLLAANVLATHRVGCSVEAEADAFEIRLTDGQAEVSWTVPGESFEAASHWSFDREIGSDGEVEVAFRDGRGAWYRVGADGDWPLPPETDSRSFFALASRRGGADGPPRGILTGVRVRIRGGRAGDRVRLARVVLLRPDPTLRDRREARLLAGRVGWHAGLDAEAWAVRAVRMDGEGSWQVPVSPDGGFVLRGLPADARVRCELLRGDQRVTSQRGSEAWLLADVVGWDFHLPDGAGLSDGR